VVPGFVAQWGIAGIPAVSAAWANPIADDARVLSNVRGTIAYAAEMNAAGQAVNRTTQVRVRAWAMCSSLALVDAVRPRAGL
jgi:hypothetical protein